MRMWYTPCRECSNRHEGCHGKCKAYQLAHILHELQLEQIRRQKRKESDVRAITEKKRDRDRRFKRCKAQNNQIR